MKSRPRFIRYPLVHIVILNWNGKEDTLRCLNSLQEIDYPNYKVTVMDNGSTDESPEAIQAAFPEVELIVNEVNLGYAGGVNVGIKRALEERADYILLLNNDTLVDKQLLTELLKVGEADPQIGILTPKIYYYGGTRIWFAGADQRWFLPGRTWPGHGKADGPAYSRQREVDYATGCGMMIKAEVLRAVGLFDTTYFMYHEDRDLCERARRAGYKVVYVPSAKMWHKVSASIGERSATKWYYLGRYIVPFYLRYSCLPYLSLISYVVGVTTRECLKGNARVIGPCLRGIRDGILATRRQGAGGHSPNSDGTS